MRVVSGRLRSRLSDPTLGHTERAFIEQLAPAFTELEETAGDTLYVEGAHRLLSENRLDDLHQHRDAHVRLARPLQQLGSEPELHRPLQHRTHATNLPRRSDTNPRHRGVGNRYATTVLSTLWTTAKQRPTWTPSPQIVE